MAKKLTGKEVASDLDSRTEQSVLFLKEHQIEPCLGVIRVGENPSDLAYERGLTKRCAKVGILVKKYILPETVREEELMQTIRQADADPAVHGILLFRPLPKHIREQRVLAEILPEKDVDCVTDGSLAGVFTGKNTGFPPCTAEAVIRMLDYYGIDCTGKDAVVIGRSIVIGKPVAMMLLGKNATVTITHTKTRHLAEKVKRADLVIAAAGHAGTVTADMLSEGHIIIDVGINADADGNLCGDVDYEAAMASAAAVTPVPGGVGSVTTAVLVSHVTEAALLQSGLK